MRLEAANFSFLVFSLRRSSPALPCTALKLAGQTARTAVLVGVASSKRSAKVFVLEAARISASVAVPMVIHSSVKFPPSVALVCVALAQKSSPAERSSAALATNMFR